MSTAYKDLLIIVGTIVGIFVIVIAFAEIGVRGDQISRLHRELQGEQCSGFCRERNSYKEETVEVTEAGTWCRCANGAGTFIKGEE